MGNFAKETVPVLVITVGAVYIWRRHLSGKGIKSCKVDDTSKEKCSGSDRLSELPDDVLSYIRSLLSLRDVARWATLSRNLGNVCVALPCLDLDWCVMSGMPEHEYHTKECEKYEKAYVKNVDHVLHNYRDQNIFSFRLSCCLDRKYAADVARWISVAAAYKHLKSLFLQFICTDDLRWCCDGHYKVLQVISCSLLSQFSSLKELHLYSCIVRLENDFRLSNLTTLDLHDVILEGTQWQGFLSSSSTIECLWLRLCNLPNKLCIGEENFPNLSFLLIGFCFDLQEVALSARNLKTFEFRSLEAVKCSFLNVPRLESVGLNRMGSECILNNLAANASSLKHMFLRGADSLIHKLPTCEGIFFWSVLSFHVDMYVDDIVVKALPHILKSFPLLRRLEIKLPRAFCGEKYEVPYIHNKLKEVKLSCFQVCWIPVATFFLKSAVVLDRMVLTKSRENCWGYESRCFTEDLVMSIKCSKKDFFSYEECKYIQNTLTGKASSTSAEVIIDNKCRYLWL